MLLALLPRVGSAGPIPTRAYVATTDFSTGSLSWCDLASRGVQADVASIFSDATLRWHGGLIYVVNRFGQDNVQVVDPAQGFATVQQFSTGNGSNPQDIAVVSPTKAYVTCLASASLLIVNPVAGTITGSISLAGFADSDGLPEATRMAIADGRLFVACERLVNFVPSDTSAVAVVDLSADTLIDVDPARPGVQGIPLVGRNPVTTFQYDPYGRRLLIGCAGAYGALDGGIEAIPLAPGGPGQPLYQSAGFVISEATLGGDLGAIAFLLPGHSYAIVSDPVTFDTRLVSFDATRGVVLRTVYAPGGFTLPDMAVSLERDELWVCDRTTDNPGLVVIRCDDDSVVAGPLATGLPPEQIVFDRDDVTLTAPPAAVPPPARAPRLALSAPRPNPARDGVALTLEGAPAGAVEAAVFDVVGRRVRALARGLSASGGVVLRWDLRDDNGNRVPAGVYLIRASVGGMSTARQVEVAW